MKTINFDSCVKLLWFTAVWKEVVNLIAFPGSLFEIWRRLWLAFLWTSIRNCSESQKHTVIHTNSLKVRTSRRAVQKAFKGECFAPCFCFCAAARGRHSNWPPRAEEKAQNAENHQLRQLCETALVHYGLKGSFQSDCIPGELIWNLKTDLTRFPLNFY